MKLLIADKAGNIIEVDETGAVSLVALGGDVTPKWYRKIQPQLVKLPPPASPASSPVFGCERSAHEPAATTPSVAFPVERPAPADVLG
jgi:hypothetical protein